jgi:hypothetical protein
MKKPARHRLLAAGDKPKVVTIVPIARPKSMTGLRLFRMKRHGQDEFTALISPLLIPPELARTKREQLALDASGPISVENADGACPQAMAKG